MTDTLEHVFRSTIHNALTIFAPRRDNVIRADIADITAVLVTRVMEVVDENRVPAFRLLPDDLQGVFRAMVNAQAGRLLQSFPAGWDHPEMLSNKDLTVLLRRSTDPLDIANYAMFAHARGIRVDRSKHEAGRKPLISFDIETRGVDSFEAFAKHVQDQIAKAIGMPYDEVMRQYGTVDAALAEAPLSPPDVQERAMEAFEAATKPSLKDPRVQLLLDVKQYGLDGVIEREIARFLIEHVIEHGFVVSVNDDIESTGEFVLYDSSDVEAILAVMFTTEGDTLFIRPVAPDQAGQRWHGWVSLVYGNGVDVVHDYSTKSSIYPDHPAMSDLMRPVEEFADSLDSRAV